MMRAPYVETVDLTCETPQNVPRPVRRNMVECMDLVAERHNVADRLLDEHVLVVDEDDADDLDRLQLLGRPLEHRPHSPSPLALEKSAGSVALGRVVQWKATS